MFILFSVFILVSWILGVLAGLSPLLGCTEFVRFQTALWAIPASYGAGSAIALLASRS